MQTLPPLNLLPYGALSPFPTSQRPCQFPHRRRVSLTGQYSLLAEIPAIPFRTSRRADSVSSQNTGFSLQARSLAPAHPLLLIMDSEEHWGSPRKCSYTKFPSDALVGCPIINWSGNNERHPNGRVSSGDRGNPKDGREPTTGIQAWGLTVTKTHTRAHSCINNVSPLCECPGEDRSHLAA
jgi:hypothetical protein